LCVGVGRDKNQGERRDTHSGDEKRAARQGGTPVDRGTRLEP